MLLERFAVAFVTVSVLVILLGCAAIVVGVRVGAECRAAGYDTGGSTVTLQPECYRIQRTAVPIAKVRAERGAK